MTDDEELMREINRHADKAEEMKPALIDRYALATTRRGASNNTVRTKLQE